MESHYKITGQDLIPVKIEEPVTRGCFCPLSCRSANLGYSIHVTRVQFVVLSMAFFTFILYKSELYKLEQFWLLSMLQSNSCYFCELCEICGLLEGLLQLCSFEVWTFGKFIILGIDSMFVKSFSMIAMKILVNFAMFATFADFSRPFLALFLSKSRIWLRLLFLLFLPYLLLSLFRQRLPRGPSWPFLF